MKKSTLLLLFILAINNLQAQQNGITLSFSAEHDGNSVNLDSILIENLTQDGSIVIYDDYMPLPSGSTGVFGGNHNNIYLSQNYPNPFREKTSIEVYAPMRDHFRLDVYSLSGQKLTNFETTLEQGMHQFTFYGSNLKHYILTVNSSMNRQQLMMIQIGISGRASAMLTYVGSFIQPKTQTATSDADFPYEIGDELRFTGYVTSDFINVGTDVITDAPTSDMDYVFDISFPLYTLMLNADPPEGGTVNGGGEYEESQVLTVEATAGEGWQFVNWTGDTDYLADPTAANTTVTMPAQNITMDAEFQEEEMAFVCGDSITFLYRGEEVTYGTIERVNRCWMDRNLGASQVPSAMDDSLGYGDLFQWGRLDDGHQDRQSSTTSTLSNTDVPGHGDFITVSSSPWDWRSPQNDNLWWGEDGANNPCAPGWRVPRLSELEMERDSWDPYNSAGAYGSTLKWPVGGYRLLDGTFTDVGTGGFVWSSSTSYEDAHYIFYVGWGTSFNNLRRAYGFSVRCIRDID